MKKTHSYSLLATLFIAAFILLLWLSLMPRFNRSTEGPLADFSAKRAMGHVKEIAKAPHYVGSAYHENVALYLEKELQKLGLETQIQQGISLSDWGNLVPCKNIMARIKGSGSGKALLLLAHYDSAPHSASKGASDDGSGVGTLLEGVRNFLHNKTRHRNDIIILFTDGEEEGLNGAALFVTEHPWAKEVGLALNFEARGSMGPGYMLMEVNRGNAAMVGAFAQASVSHPVSNSLMYSIYKMLPNDTDLTVFREHGQIPGFNFAFIDDHFNYHTAQDDYAHLDEATMAHQGSYLMPLLHYAADADLDKLDSDSEHVYFSGPYFFLHYPFGWNVPLLVVATLLFVFLVFIGLGKRMLQPAEIARGFVPLLGATGLAAGLTFFGWRLCLAFYPEYKDILQGFPYNGHDYIAAFVFLSLSVAFLCYVRVKSEIQLANYTIAPLLLWIVLNALVAFALPGAGFFIIPVLFGLIMLAIYITTQRSFPLLNLLLAIPALVLFVPFITMFPIGLGLKILAGSAALTVLVFTLLLPVFGAFERKGLWAFLLFAVFVGFMVKAQYNSAYAPGQARPNSLLYVYDANRDKAAWTTYDTRLDEWSKIYLGDNPKPATRLNSLPLFSKYDTRFSYLNDALVREIPEPAIRFLRDSTAGKFRFLKIMISPNRKVNRYDIFADPKAVFYHFKANGTTALGQKGSLYQRQGRRLLSYYVADNTPLTMEFTVLKDRPLDLQLMESSFDLMDNPAFAMEKRKPDMMPMPFVLTDAVVLLKKISPTGQTAVAVPVAKNFSLQEAAMRDTIPDPEAEINLPERVVD